MILTFLLRGRSVEETVVGVVGEVGKLRMGEKGGALWWKGLDIGERGL